MQLIRATLAGLRHFDLCSFVKTLTLHSRSPLARVMTLTVKLKVLSWLCNLKDFYEVIRAYYLVCLAGSVSSGNVPSAFSCKDNRFAMRWNRSLQRHIMFLPSLKK